MLERGRAERSTPISLAPERNEERRRRARLCCVSCMHPVTSSADAIEVSGAHAHTFVNPHGEVFELGCFAQAPGAGAAGPPETFFSWFPGYAWRVGICRACTLHLGWAFTDPGGGAPNFWGLITARLVESDGSA